MSNFFVHIIESPSDQDFLNRKTEGHLLTSGLSIANIPFSYNIAVNKNTFIEALTTRLFREMGTFRRFPFLHLSAHGNIDGLALTNREFFKWDELDKYLSPINSVINGYLAVSISACSGYAGCRMAIKPTGPSPFYWIIGPTEDISLSDTAVAFLSLYHLLAKGFPIAEALTAMKTASGNQNFEIILAKEIRQKWEDFNKNMDEKTLTAILGALELFKK